MLLIFNICARSLISCCQNPLNSASTSARVGMQWGAGFRTGEEENSYQLGTDRMSRFLTGEARNAVHPR